MHERLPVDVLFLSGYQSIGNIIAYLVNCARNHKQAIYGQLMVTMEAKVGYMVKGCVDQLNPPPIIVIPPSVKNPES